MRRATTRPRRAGSASSAAKGIMTWPATDAAPMARLATSKSHSVGAAPARASQAAFTMKMPTTRVRRGCRSPSGTTRTRPAA